MTRVLIAVDDTQESVHAADVAGRLFGDEAEYFAISVADVDPGVGEPSWWGAAWGTPYRVPYGAVWPVTGVLRARDAAVGVDDPASQTAAARRAAENTARAVVEESSVTTAQPIADVGKPADAIIDAAIQHSADVIVLGTHDRGWFDRLLHGSVGKDVVGQSNVPVLVIPSRDGEQET